MRGSRPGRSRAGSQRPAQTRLIAVEVSQAISDRIQTRPKRRDTDGNLALSLYTWVEFSEVVCRLVGERLPERVGGEEEVLANVLRGRYSIREDLKVADPCHVCAQGTRPTSARADGEREDELVLTWEDEVLERLCARRDRVDQQDTSTLQSTLTRGTPQTEEGTRVVSGQR